MRGRWAIEVLSGERRTADAMLLRGALSLAEPLYAMTMSARNLAYSRGFLKTHALPRPTISVGNLTTGGTGKTPVVRWLAERLLTQGLRPAVLLRGYRAGAGASDEQQVLAEALGGVSVVANPNRLSGAMSAMAALPQPDVFVLDDAFQHRRVRRDFDLVLIDATQPFGFDHVLPRGLLREPVRGLARSDAVIITRSDQATSPQLQAIEARVRRYVPPGAIYFARHALVALRGRDGAAKELAELARQPFYAFAGIANPDALRQQLQTMGRCVGFARFDDHHAYTSEDMTTIARDAAATGAKLLVTTEKDWVKFRALPTTDPNLPILRLDLRIEFRDDQEQRLLAQVLDRLQPQAGLRGLSAGSRRG